MKKRYRKRISILLIFALLFSQFCPVYAAESATSDEVVDSLEYMGPEEGITAEGAGEYYSKGTFHNGVEWVLDNALVLRISGNGEIPSFSSANDTSEWRYAAKIIKRIVIDDNITAIGNYAFAGCTALRYAKTPKELTSVGNYAFSGCTNLQRIILSQNAVTIGISSFYGCKSMKELAIPKTLTTVGNQAFLNCEALSDIYYEGSVADKNANISSIGTGNDSFKSATWHYNSKADWYDGDTEDGSSDTGIVANGQCGPGTFWSVEKEDIGYRLIIVRDTAVDDGSVITDGTYQTWNDLDPDIYTNILDLDLETGVTSIPEDCFTKLEGLTAANMSYTVAGWGNHAFMGLKKLEEVNITEPAEGAELSKMEIGEGVFQNCFALESINLPKGMAITGSSFGGYLFSGDKALKYVILPSGVSEIPEGWFSGCVKLKDIYFGGSEYDWTQIEINETENEVLLEAKIHYKDTSPVVDDIEAVGGKCGDNLRWSVTGTGAALTLSIVGNGPMYDYWSEVEKWGTYGDRIRYIEIQRGVTRIGSHAFHDFTSLTTVQIPATVTEIDDYAFYNCTNLPQIDLPENIVRIGKHAFDNNTKLAAVGIPKTIKEIGRYAFNPSGLKNINYAGDEDEWKAVSIGYKAFPDFNSVNYLGKKEVVIEYPSTFVAGQKYDILNNQFKDVTNAEFFKVNGKKIAKIDKRGILKAKKPGYAVVYAMGTDENGKSYAISSCEIRVVKKPKLVFNRSFTSVSDQFSAYDYIKDPSSRIVSANRWDSSDPSVATVDEHTGLVSISGQGITVISATYGEDHPLVIKRRIKVRFPTLKTEFLDVSTGKSKKIKIKYIKKKDRVQYTSLSSNIASVANGKVTGRSPGTTSVTVSVNGVEIGSCEVNVY